MTFPEKIERAFAGRQKPAQMIGEDVVQIDSDVEEALWFRERDWHDITWQDWEGHSCAIFFFSPEAFAYYLPSVLLLSTENRTDSLLAADSLIGLLDRSPDADGWTENFATPFLELHTEELEVLKEWLLKLCEYLPYKGWGIAASGPGDRFGRAYDTIDLLQKEVERRRMAGN